MKILSPAKINLGLQVLNKRKDGYHNINTVFYPVNIFDELEFSPSEQISVTTVGMNLPMEENIVYQAAFKLRKKIGIQMGADIKLTKRLPSGAGLGAGSANAAITLLALKSMWKSDISNTELLIIAQSLGADVPFFLRKGAAVGASRGEKLNYIGWQAKHKIAIVSPDIHISTPEAYRALGRTDKSPSPIDFPKILYRSDENPSLLNMLTNDFEAYAFSAYPEIKAIKKKLYSEGAVFSMMSGSGSSIFAFFEKEKDLKGLSQIFSDCRVYLEDESGKAI